MNTQENNQNVNLIHNNRYVNSINNNEQLLVTTYRDVAKKALTELSISLIFTGLTAIFVTPFSLPMLFALPVIMVLFNAVIRSIPIHIQSKITALRASGGNEDEIRKLERYLAFSLKVVKVVCPFNFAIVDINTRGLIMHEAGHFLAASALYKNANPSVKLYPGKTGNPLWLFTGETTWSNKELTPFGQSIGSQNSEMIAAGAGAGISLLGSIILLTLSYKYRHTKPELSRYFLASAIATIVQHIFYALSAFWEKGNNYNDFGILWAGGINPIVSIICLALPLMVRAGLAIKESFQRNRAIPLQNSRSLET
jgi:hypothetical protein